MAGAGPPPLFCLVAVWEPVRGERKIESVLFSPPGVWNRSGSRPLFSVPLRRLRDGLGPGPRMGGFHSPRLLTTMKFVDEVQIKVWGGRGGNGCVSFRREKYVPKGGPDGGDGGRGGNVILEAAPRKHTLLDFHFRHLFRAPSGRHGQGQNRHGRSGRDLVLMVPVGTLVKDASTGEILTDLNAPGQRWIAAWGGMGGRGNARFVSPVRQVPREAEEGREGEEKGSSPRTEAHGRRRTGWAPQCRKIDPHCGCIRRPSQIADYPFTTLVPQLGVARYGDSEPFVLADIPGLIQGAHEGAGLGTRFLRHIERTRLLIHVIDGSSLPAEDPLKPYRQVEYELLQYSEQMGKKPRIIRHQQGGLGDRSS